MIRVLLIDDHEMVRMGLAAFLEAQPDIEVIGEASDGSEGVRLAVELSPDVILMDLVMEGMDGIQATKQICRELSDPKIIVLTSFIDDDKVYPVIEAGALSYLLKTSKAAEIADAIRAARRESRSWSQKWREKYYPGCATQVKTSSLMNRLRNGSSKYSS